jgi:hypothetical protein
MSVQNMKFEGYRCSQNTCAAYSSKRNICVSFLQHTSVVDIAIYEDISENCWETVSAERQGRKQSIVIVFVFCKDI